MMGRIHSIQTMGTVDGPGVRFVVFLQGCDLRCDYCHNPDTWAHENTRESFLIDSEDLATRANRYRSYYGKTPGITVSGGEALCQQEFVIELFQACKRFGFHTALDTAGSKIAKPELIELTDLCLLDIKYATEEEYQSYTGGSLQQTLLFLRQLEENNVPTWIRQVIVPGRNDTEEAVETLNRLIKDYRCIEKIEFLPFRKLCLEKYEQMGMKFPLQCLPETTEEVIRRVKQYYKECK